MTASRWPRIKALFHDALDQPAAERAAWLAREAGGNTALAADVERLIAAHEGAGEFLTNPPLVDPAAIAEAADAAAEQVHAGRRAATPLQPGDRLGSYEIRELLGRGGMGIVYLAEDPRLRRRVAIKALPPEAAGDPGWRERLRREARAAATISHPAVAAVHTFEEHDGHPFIVTEYVAGQSLRSLLDHDPPAVAHAAAIAHAVAGALQAAHGAGVVHRDLKPDNVMVAASGAVKVVDFGIAALPGHVTVALTAPGLAVGTPAYMAPEQRRGEPADARVDIYAFGVMLREMLVRAPGAHDAAERRLLAELSAVADHCARPAAADRYPSATALLDALQAAPLPAASPQPAAAHGARVRSPALWWWQFHQLAAVAVYPLLIVPAFRVRDLMGSGARAFLIVLVGSVIVSSVLRLHLWFTSRFYPRELPSVRRTAALWVRGADLLFAAALVIGGLLIEDRGRMLDIVLVSLGLGVGLTTLVIEPSTTRAAFGAGTPG